MRAMPASAYCPGGDRPVTSLKRVTVRCTSCNRRFLLASVLDELDLHIGWKTPAHKPKEKTTKKVTRKWLT